MTSTRGFSTTDATSCCWASPATRPRSSHSWAKDADFQFLFGSDPGSKAYAQFGGDPRDNGMVGSRAVIVVAPDGTIADVTPAFNQVDPAAYEHLQSVIDKVTPEAP